MKLISFPFMHRNAALTVLVSIRFLQAVHAQILDQNQPVWNGGTSERNLPGYYEWQSFKAGMSGSLCRIDLMFCNTNVKVNGTGTLKVFTGQGTAGTLLLTQSVSVNGTSYNFNQPFWQTWNLSSTPSIIANSTYTFQFIPTQAGGLTDPYLIQINIPSVYANGQNYNLGTMGDCAFRTYVLSALPVELLALKGENIGGINHITWSTASEINNDYFEIERGNNGNDFKSIGLIQGSGNSSHLINYSFEDSHPLAGINYYRLKQVDYDGKFDYSDVVAVISAIQREIVCSPNPFKSDVNLEFRSAVSGTMTFRVLDQMEKEMKYIPGIAVMAGLNNIRFDLSGLNEGVYFFRIEFGSTIQTIKVIKY